MSPSPKCTLFLTISVRRKQKSGFVLAAVILRVKNHDPMFSFCLIKNNKIRTPSSLECLFFRGFAAYSVHL